MNKERITFLKEKYGIKTESNEKTITDYLLQVPKKEKRTKSLTIQSTSNTERARQGGRSSYPNRAAKCRRTKSGRGVH